MPSERHAKIVALDGSLAPVSRSLTVLRVAAEAAEEEGTEVQIIDVGQLDLQASSAPG